MALRAPTSVLGLMSGARLLLKSQTGMPGAWSRAPQPPLPHAMFRHALATSKPFVVEDIKRHPLTKDMVLGEGWEHAAYCGVPILLANRKVVGVLAVFDPKPRPWTEREIGFLQDLADSAGEEIEQGTVAVVEPAPEPRTEVGRAAAPAPAVAAPVVAVPAVPEHAAPPTREVTAPDLSMHAPDGLLALDDEGRITEVNQRAERILRRTRGELIGRTLAEAYPGLPATIGSELERALDEHDVVTIEERCRSLQVWLEARVMAVEGGRVVHLRDVTARRETEEALRHSEARYRAVFQEARDPIVFTAADGTITECNRAMVEQLGYPREELFRMRLAGVFADEAERDRFLLELDQVGAVSGQEARLLAKDGRKLECTIAASTRRGVDGSTIGYQVMLEDRTEHNRTRQQLLHNAFHDVLTGLPNRSLFMDRLERVLVQSKRRPSYRFAVLFVDLDRFKLVNDTLGHMAGDALLVAVARRLEGCLRAEDTVARFGGDEFAILLDSIQDVRDATRIAERINFELALPFRVGRREVASSASIGIALSATGYDRADDVLHDADAAMYRAKAGGRARYEVFDTGMHARAAGLLQLERDLRKAVEAVEFDVFYQPIIELKTGTVVGVEALVRWRHPERGLLLPDEFLAVAETTGLIVPIGWAVAREACRQVRAWELEAAPNGLALTLGLNLSARQFHQPDLVPRMEEILRDTGLDPSRLRLELTEQVVMGDPELAAAMMGDLRAQGVRIALDDFGTGFTSLQHLQQLPIAALKIDRSFVSRLGNGDAERGVVESIVALGSSLAIDAVAEGVETLEQLQVLRTLGARFAQGFLFSEPLNAAAATALVLDRTS
jgi:diguanylate cyclase (GGDEF)-like protein/PAS domain S-box-containing protein